MFIPLWIGICAPTIKHCMQRLRACVVEPKTFIEVGGIRIVATVYSNIAIDQFLSETGDTKIFSTFDLADTIFLY